MKGFTPILCLVAAVLAEPPVGGGYPSARSSLDHHHQDDHHQNHQNQEHEHADQRDLSQEYGPPDFESTRNAPSEGYENNTPNGRSNGPYEGYEYNTPSGRSNAPSESYNAPNSRNSDAQSDGYDYNAPTGRSSNAPSERYNAPNGRSSNAPTDGYEYNAPNGRSAGRGRFPPATVRVSFNQRFKPAASRSADRHSSARLSQRGTPTSSPGPAVSARTLSTEYGMPDTRSTPSQEYGAPVLSARSSHSTEARTNSQSSKSSTLSRSRSNEAPKASFGARNALSEKYGVPSSRSQSQASTRRSDSEVVDSVSQTYGTPSQKEVSETYGVPNARSSSHDPEVPSSVADLMTSAVASSFADVSSRSSPSSTYLPASRSAAPSEQYGAPAQRDSTGGYDYSRDKAMEEAKRARALEELQNQGPASYDFGYSISEQASGSEFGHTESREADRTQGSYFVVRPDGSKQTVDYEADENGFKPRISVEPAETARSGGYDHNAQDSARDATGPY